MREMHAFVVMVHGIQGARRKAMVAHGMRERKGEKALVASTYESRTFESVKIEGPCSLEVGGKSVLQHCQCLT